VFLHAAGTHSPLRVALKAGGYFAADHAEGLRLLNAACPYIEDGFDPTADEVSRRAAAELDAWTKTHLMRLKTAIERLHPHVGALFPERMPAGAEAILVVAELLERLTKLESEPDGADVIATLARRGLDDGTRRHLAALVRDAQHAQPPPVPSDDDNAVTNELEAELSALHRWYDDWAGTARAIIPRKDWLIRLGVLERRRRE
jgi:hypothetical protein